MNNSTIEVPAVLSTSRQATLREFFAVLFRRRALVFGLFGIVTLTIVVLTLAAPKSFTSSGRVLVYRGERESALNTLRMFYGEWESELGSEVARARSSTIIDRAREILRERAKAAGRPVPKFDPGRVDVEVMGRSNVLGIAYTDPDKDVAHQMCDAFITAYIDVRQTTQIGKPESFFEAELQNLDAEIERRMREREMLSAASGVTNAIDQSRTLAGQLASLEQKRAETSADLAESKKALEWMLQLQKNPDMNITSVDKPFGKETAVDALNNRIVEQQARIATMRERYRDDAPEVQNAVATLATLQALLRKEVDGGLEIARSRIALHQSRVDALDRDIAEVRGRLSAMPSSQRRLDDLEAEIKTLRMRYDDYSKSRDIARINSNTSQELNVVLLNPAGPGVPRNQKDWVRLALAPAFSLIVGIGLAFFIDGLDLTVRTAAQAEEYLDVPVLASLSERRRRG